MSSVLLEVKQITKDFGGIRALNDVSAIVNKGEILGLIGPNGAGKTTLFNIIAGHFNPTLGNIEFKGNEITKMKSAQITKLGIARTFQLVQVFPNLTVLENVLLGALYGRDEPVTYAQGTERSMDALRFIGMDRHAHNLVSTLVLTDRKKIELARALATNPDIILLDEIIAGLNHTETDEMLEIINNVNKEKNITIILVEHVMKAVMSISDRIIVLNNGKKIAEGTPTEITQNELVIEAYLGTAAKEATTFVKNE